MGLFRSNYAKLRSLNNDKLATISPSNQSILIRMFNYLSTSNISIFELETSKKDLLRLAEEADIENTSISDKLGSSEIDFCKELISVCQKPHLLSLILPLLRNTFIIILPIYFVYFFLADFPQNYGISIDMLISALTLCVIDLDFGYTSLFVWGRTTYSHSYKTRKFLLLLSIIIIRFITIPFLILRTIYVIKGNGWFIFTILAFSTTILWFVTNYYFDYFLEKP